jgi:predicted AlkP superfamily phosphohydrolase/phosphomutase
MTARVIAIGLDAGDPLQIQRLMDAGRLPNLRRLRDHGAWADLDTFPYYADESVWTTFLTGRTAAETGHWTSLRLVPGTYDIYDSGYHDFIDPPLFFTHSGAKKLAVFDLPHCNTLWDQINGVHVIGWGAHAHFDRGVSVPRNLFDELVGQYGEHPAVGLQYVGLNWWNPRFLKTLHTAAIEGIERRSRICRDLLNRDRWDLFLTVFPDIHYGSHHFEHLSRGDHPLWADDSAFREDPLASIYSAVDTAIGELIADAAPEDRVVVFSLHGHGPNHSDLPTLVFLPELLYRISFPERQLFPRGIPGAPCPPVFASLERSAWPNDLWARRVDSQVRRVLLSPFSEGREYGSEDEGHPGFVREILGFPGRILESLRRRMVWIFADIHPSSLRWCPPLWYQRWWPKMRAFALPSFADGNIRINLKGREPQGVVEPREYRAECDRLAEELLRVTDAVTGAPLVKDIWMPRNTGLEDDPKLPYADLAVLFHERPTHVVDSPTCGRIGPIPYLRVSSHRNRGFVLARGRGISPRSMAVSGQVADVPATLLHLMRVPLPPGFAGRSLL